MSEALLLIGLGVVWAFDFWWPGMIAVVGISWSTSLALRRKFWAAAVVATLMCVVPAVYLVAPARSELVPVAIVGLGAVGLARAAYLRSRVEGD